MGRLFGTFKNRHQATEALRKIAQQHQLCLKTLGLESGSPGPCIAYPLKRCKGVCCGAESAEIHGLRLQQALMAHKLKIWPYAGKIGIEEYNLENDIRQIHVFDSDERLQELITQTTTFKFDLDTYKLLLKVLAQKKTRVLNLTM
jgi:DNA polymerase III subunit epsilon